MSRRIEEKKEQEGDEVEMELGSIVEYPYRSNLIKNRCY